MTIPAQPQLRILSLGAGVQSTTLLLMACEGKFDPGLDLAIFADTGWEPAAVYHHLDKITAFAADAGIPVIRVSKGNLRADMLDPGSRFATIPYFVLNPDGTTGMGRRQCTSEYKLVPIKRKVRELLGASPPTFRRVPRGHRAEQWIGFSSDEIGRVSNHDGVSYLLPRYPLIELGMDRKACQRWLDRRGWTSVTKSACIGCPYHGNRQWRQLRDEHPDEWADAVEFDHRVRHHESRRGGLIGDAYLHRSCLPLDQAPIDHVTRSEHRARQGDLLDLLAELEDGDPDGCSPYGCRSGQPVRGTP